MTQFCYNTSAWVRDAAERVGGRGGRGGLGGWQTETWHERRGNAGLIIHTYCCKGGWEREHRGAGGAERCGEEDGLREESEGRDWPKWEGIPRAVVHSGSRCCASPGPWGWGNSAVSCQKTSDRDSWSEWGRGGRYSWILWEPAH